MDLLSLCVFHQYNGEEEQQSFFGFLGSKDGGERRGRRGGEKRRRFVFFFLFFLFFLWTFMDNLGQRASGSVVFVPYEKKLNWFNLKRKNPFYYTTKINKTYIWLTFNVRQITIIIISSNFVEKTPRIFLPLSFSFFYDPNKIVSFWLDCPLPHLSS